MKHILHTLKHSFSVILLLALLGFHGVGWGQVNITPIRTAVTGFSDWTDVSIGGTTYLQLITATSSTISPSMNFDNYTAEVLKFNARTFGGPNETQATITVSINTGSGWIVLGTRIPPTNSLTEMTAFDLSAYNGSTVQIRFQTLGASASKGVGIDDIDIKGVLNTDPPTKLAITSIIPSSPAAGGNFSVTVQAQDASNNPANVTSATAIALTKETGTGTLGGTLTGSIANGSNSVTISGVTYNTAETGVSITATPTTGMTGLTAATSSTFTVLAALPTPSSAVNITSRTNNSVGLSWTSGNGVGRIVVARFNSSSGVAPAAGAAYTPNSASFSDASNPTTGTDNVVVYNGTGNSLTITGLSAATAYNFEVYEYNGSTSTYNYAAAASAGSTSTLANEPTTQPSAISFSSVTATGMTIGCSAGNGTNRIFVVKAGSAVDFIPVDGTAYTPNLNFTLGAGLGPNSDNKVVAVTGTSAVVTGLSSNTTYYVAVYEFNGSSTTINYLTTSPLIGNRTTVPTVASGVNVAARTATSMDLSWTNGNGTGRILVARATSSTLVAPTYGTSYTVNSNDITDLLNGSTGTGNIVVYNGTGSSTSVTGLSPATQYQFYVYEYNTSSNYAAAASSSATYTFPTEPTTQASALSFTGVLSTAFTVDFTKGDGASRVILVKAGSAVAGIPVDGISYSTAAYGSGTQIGTGNYVVYSGTAGSATITGLSPNTTYYVGIFEFNGTGGNSNYLTSAPATGNQITLVAAPAAPTNLTFASITYNSFNASFTAPGTAPSGYLVLRRKGAVISGTPVGGTVYTAGESIGAAANEIIYVGTSAWSAYAQTGLEDGTTYYYDVYSYNGTGTQTSYSLTALSGNQTTSAVPAPNATAATAVTSTGFNANWDAVTGASGGYLLDVSTSNQFVFTNVSENFAGFNTNNGSTDRSGSLDTYLQTTGWTGSAIFEMVGYAKMGSGSSKGIITTKTLDLSANSGNAILTFDLSLYGTDGTLVQVFHAPDGTTFTQVGNDITPPAAFATQTISITGGTVNSKIRIAAKSASNNRFYLDNIIVKQNLNISGYDNLAVSGTSQAISGLSSNTTYYYRVRAVGSNSTSANSNVISATTPLPIYTLLGAEDAAAANYSSWANSSNEGCGFGAWTLTSGGSGGSYLGGTGLGASTFGIYSGGDGAGNYFTARRDFIEDMPVGSIFGVSLGYTGVSNGGSIGISLFSNNNFRLTFKFVGGDSFWVINDGGSDFATTIPWDDNAPLSFAFTRGSGNVYSLAITQSAITYNAGNYTAITGTMDIDRIDIFTTGQGGGNNLGFDHLSIKSDPSLIPAVSSVFVKGCVELAEDFEVEDLTIESGNTLQVNAGFDLTVNGTLDNQADASALVLKSDNAATASLIHSSAGVAATTERYIPGSTNNWHLLSSPVAEQVITGNFTDANGYDFYMWSEGDKLWVNRKNVSSGSGTAPFFDILNGSLNFNPGQGYLVAYVDPNTNAKSFAGNLNNGNVLFTLKYSGTGLFKGSNLMGNPYPSGIDWNKASRTQFADNYAYAYNPLKSGGEGYEQINGGVADAFIAPNQGFVVLANSDQNDETFTFTNSMRAHGGSFYKNSELQDKISLRFGNETNFDETAIWLNVESNFNRDRNDAIKIYSYNAAIPQVYSLTMNQVEVAINSIPAINEEAVIPVGLYVPAQGNYFMSLSSKEGLFANQVVYLEDKLTGIRHNLNENNTYNFSASPSDNANRFKLTFSTLSIDNPATASSISVYTHGETLYISGLEAKAEISVVNLTGQVVLSSRTNGSGLHSVNAASLPKGVYVVSVISNGQAISRKVVL